MYKAKIHDRSINLLDKKNVTNKAMLTSQSYKSQYRCPVCNEPVRIAWGNKRAPHFKHRPESNCVYTTSESPEHLSGKKMLYEYFAKLLKHKAIEIDIEHYIPETGQIADIYIKFSNQVQWVIEYQRSNISPDEILKRRQLYSSIGIKDIWIVGENIVKSDGLLLCNIKNAGQVLINEEFETTSLVCFDPKLDIISIYRGLMEQNERSYTYNNVYEYKLEDIAVNLWGEIFCFDDYYGKVIPSTHYPKVAHKIFPGMTTCQTLYRSDIPGYNFKLPINDRYHHLNISAPLDRYLPVELKEVVLVLDYLNDPITFNDDTFLLAVKDLYPKRWDKFLEERKVDPEIRMEKWPLTNAFLIEGLYSIYTEKFQTAKEFEKHLSIFEKEQMIPHSTKIYSLCKYGILEQEILKTELNTTVEREKALYLLIRLLNKNIIESDSLEFALANQLLLPHEEEMSFNLTVFSNVLIRVKEMIPVSPNYSGVLYEGVGLWHTITDLKDLNSE